MSISTGENIYVTILSNDSLDIYKNSSNTFTNLLKHPLYLSENWVVGLADISFTLHKTNDTNNINRKRRSIAINENQRLHDEIAIKFKKSIEKHKISSPSTSVVNQNENKNEEKKNQYKKQRKR